MKMAVKYKCALHKNLFVFLEAICNLATEFNGLVSTKGRCKNRPFYFFIIADFFLFPPAR